MYQDTKTDRIIAWGTIPAIFIAIVIWMAWTLERDEKLVTAMQAYEDCTLEHYKTTPAQYYNENGFLPECDFNSLNK